MADKALTQGRGMMCSLCNVYLSSASDVELHFTGKRHRKNQMQQTENEETQLKSIFVNHLGPLTLATIQEYFSQYGTVCNMLVFQDKNNQKRLFSVIVEFESEETVEAIMPRRIRCIHHIPIPGSNPVCHQLVNVSERKFKSRPERSPSPQPPPEISLSIIKLKLSLMFDLDEQLEEIVELIQLDDEDIENRKAMCANISKTFARSGYPECMLYPFGSSVNGLGFKGCDIDVYLDLGNVPSRENPLIEVPVTLTEVQKVRIAGNILRTIPQCTKVFTITSARVPIVKFIHRPTGIHCDISFKNKMSVFNSEFIRFCTEVDTRVRPLMMALKLLGKRYNIAGGGGGTRMSNYALAMLVIFYLQQLEKPLLYSVHTLQKHLKEEPEYINGWNTAFSTDFNRLPALPVNKQGKFELLHGFFIFYSTLDFTKHLISPYLGRLVTREELTSKLPEEFENIPKFLGSGMISLIKPVCFQDPFELSHNIAKNLQDKTVSRLKTIFRLAADVCEDLKAPGIVTPGGFNRLLDMEVDIEDIDVDEIVEEFKETYGVKVNLAFLLETSDTLESVKGIVHDIFEKALMFEPVVSARTDDSEVVVKSRDITEKSTVDNASSECEDVIKISEKLTIETVAATTTNKDLESGDSKKPPIEDKTADNTTETANNSGSKQDMSGDLKRKSDNHEDCPAEGKKMKTETEGTTKEPIFQEWKAKFPVWSARKKFALKHAQEFKKCSVIERERKITESQCETFGKHQALPEIQFKCYFINVQGHVCIGLQVLNTQKRIHEHIFSWLRSYVPDILRKIEHGDTDGNIDAEETEQISEVVKDGSVESKETFFKEDSDKTATVV